MTPVSQVNPADMLYPVGVDDLFIALMTTQDTSITAPAYAPEIYRIPTIETIGLSGNQTSATKWASNKLFVSVSKNATHTITLDHTAIPVEVMDKILGFLAKKGIVFEKAKARELPYFALGFITPLSDGHHIARWYPRVQVTPPQESYTTTTEETTIPTQQLVMTAYPLRNNDATKVDFNSARTSATGVTAEAFMAQVIHSEGQIATLFPDDDDLYPGSD